MVYKRKGEYLKVKKPLYEEFRWEIVKAMLDEYPGLRKRVRDYVRKC